MRFSHFLCVICVAGTVSLTGCSSSEPTAVDQDELAAYTEENAEQLAEEERLMELEEESEDEDD